MSADSEDNRAAFASSERRSTAAVLDGRSRTRSRRPCCSEPVIEPVGSGRSICGQRMPLPLSSAKLPCACAAAAATDRTLYLNWNRAVCWLPSMNLNMSTRHVCDQFLIVFQTYVYRPLAASYWRALAPEVTAGSSVPEAPKVEQLADCDAG